MIFDVNFFNKKLLKNWIDWIWNFDGIGSNRFHNSIVSETDLKSSKTWRIHENTPLISVVTKTDNDHKLPANDHKRPNKPFRNSSYLIFFINWKQVGVWQM